jgi:hypothetical protein
VSVKKSENLLKFQENLFSLFTLQGEPITGFNPMTLLQHTAFVLVPNCESYLCRTYEKIFQKTLNEMKTKSMPTIPEGSDCCPPLKPRCPKKSPCAPDSDDESVCGSMANKASSVLPCGQSPCSQGKSPSFGQNVQQRSSCGCPKSNCPKPKCPPPSDECVKPPCVFEESDDCPDCPSIPKINYKCKSRKPPTPMVLRKNQGFFAKCCPCCVSQYKCEKEVARPVTSGCNPTSKLTQTTKEDFSMSQRTLKKAIQEEKQRQKLFKKKPIKPCKQKRDICAITSDEEDDDPKKLMKREKARERYCLKRRKMEQKLKKALEKQYKNDKPC